MKTNLCFGAVLAALLFSACSADEKLVTGGTQAYREKNEGLFALQNIALESLKKNFSFEAEREEVSFTTESGVIINIDPSRLTINGQPVQGNLVVEYIEIFGRASMVTANKSTMGMSENADEGSAPLQSAGEFFIQISREGQSVDEGSPYQILVPTELTGGGDNEMIIWTGTTDDGGDITWEKDLNDDGSEKDAPIEDDKYKLNLSTFGWCNIDKIPNTSGQLTKLYVDVPTGYNDQNSRVYLAYHGAQNLLAQLDMYDSSSELFYEHGEYIPVGTNGDIILVSGIAGNWEIAVVAVTIGVDSTIVINQSDINPATQNDVSNIINNLP